MSNLPNPFSDFWDFVIGNTEDLNALGAWKYLFVALFLALIIASIVIAIKNWQEDPSQRSGSHLGTWFVRLLVGGMWFKACCGSCRCRSRAACNTGPNRWPTALRSSSIASW